MNKPMATLTGKDLVLLLLYVPGFQGQKCEEVSGRTRLTKMVFLFEKEVWPKFKFDKIMSLEDLPKFVPYDFGPFSTSVFADLDFLGNLKLVSVAGETGEVVSEEEALEYQWWLREVEVEEPEPRAYENEIFGLSDKGVQFVEEKLLARLSENQVDALRALKERCTGVSLKSLLRYVYTRYEDYTVNSKIRDEILNTRADDREL